MSDVTSAGSVIVAIGNEDRDFNTVAAVWTSPDGFVWSRVPQDEAAFGQEDHWPDAPMRSVVAARRGLVAVGSALVEGSDPSDPASEAAAVWVASPEG